MRLLNKNDDIVWKTIRFASRQSSPQKFASDMLLRAETVLTNADYWYEYGLCCFEFMNIVEQSQAKHQFLTGAINSCSQALRIEANHWPALFIRSQVALLLEIADNRMLASYLLPEDYRLEEAVLDQYHMIEMQKDAVSQPYFFLPYVVLSLVHFSFNRTIEGQDILLRGVEMVPEGSIGMLHRVLSIPLAIIGEKLKASGNQTLFAIVNNRFRKAFPAKVTAGQSILNRS
jgi:hypothetical protein